MKTLHTILTLLILTLLKLTPTNSLNQDGLYLQTLTHSLSDPNRHFSSWNPRHDTPCNWTGVLCTTTTTNSTTVTSLDFTSFNLTGPFPIILCRLQRLTSLIFYDNSLTGSLPETISACSGLVHLDLSFNLLVGEIPASLSEISGLRYLDLSGNNFSGEVPVSFGGLENLEVASLTDNLLDGEFPNVLTNVSTLKVLNLSYNSFRPSRLGDGLGNMAKLETFWASNCNLIGEIPESIIGLKSIITFDVSENKLTGKIPSSLTELTSLVQLELFDNSLTGELPQLGWEKMTNLRNFDASINNITGRLPETLTKLLQLASLNLYSNALEGTIPSSVADSRNLYELKLFSNRFTGELPSHLGVNSALKLVDVSYNRLSGKIPSNICANGELSQLLLIQNSFSGEIPASLSECRSLTRVRLSHNKFSGDVPAGFWGLPHVSLLELNDNAFTGEIPISIASALNLSQLLISDNEFSVEIPEEIGFLGNLVSFIANNNKFSGRLPVSIVKLVELGVLHLNNNELSGELPDGIKNLIKLTDLNLADNRFSGLIPAEIGDLSINYLDLSNNQFSGRIPDEIGNLKLNQFNFSNNRLSGGIPPFYAKEMYRNSFLGNPGLCDDLPGLCVDSNNNNDVKKKNQGYFWGLRCIFIITAIILVFAVFWFYRKYKVIKNSKRSIDRSKWTLMSFHKLGFNEFEILDCLDEDNVIGTGASGKVYKAVLSNGEIVAVKKLWSSLNKDVNNGGTDIEKGSGEDGFEAEVETLGKIRHKNIVRLWCCCKTKGCKLLVYEYMINGSLGDFLHGPKSGLLDWPTRYRVGLDAAEGLSYLHHDCVPPIVHRDIKSNNILLDGDFGAKVADFGVAKVVDAIGKGSKSMSVIAGSCGYIAPEYAYTLRVNEKSDTYSFGVVLLELVTGKRPVDPDYGEKDLVNWVCTTMDQKSMDHVLDPKLDSCFREEICKVLHIGLLCTSPLPINRPSMRRVVKMLLEVSGENHLKPKDGKLTPYYYEDASDQGSVA